MKKLDTLAIKAKLTVENKIEQFLSKKRSGDSHFVAIAFTLLIVVAIALIFRGQITTLMENIFKVVGDSINDTIGG